jgi:hypothetical protein
VLPQANSGQPNKKTLDPSQNLENKGSEIFLPPRSMVLKVVRGKILETLELSRVSTALRLCEDRPACERLSVVKDRSFSDHDYLVDNRCLCMLSEVEGQIKGKTVGRLIQFQFGNVVVRVFVPCGACVERDGFIAALEALRHPKSCFPLSPKFP